jgi:hypothetical protein
MMYQALRQHPKPLQCPFLFTLECKDDVHKLFSVVKRFPFHICFPGEDMETRKDMEFMTYLGSSREARNQVTA